MKFDEIDIHDFGNSLMISGVIWSSADKNLITLFPDSEHNYTLTEVEMTFDDWTRMIRQTDLLETEIFADDPNKKTIYRKSQRTIDSFVTWQIYKRDNYTCRYCGKDGIPMSVDHIDLWENGGATIPENLLTACKKCNKDRGRMEYEDWLKSPSYAKKSVGLSPEMRQQNLDVLNQLADLVSKRVTNIRSR